MKKNNNIFKKEISSNTSVPFQKTPKNGTAAQKCFTINIEHVTLILKQFILTMYYSAI